MFIVAFKPGQLANRLTQFATFIAFARENNLKIMNPGFDEYAELFETTSSDLWCRYPSRRSLLGHSAKARNLIFQFSYYLARSLVRLKINSRYLRTISIDWDAACRLDDPLITDSIRNWQLVFAQGWAFNCKPLLSKHIGSIREYFTPLSKYLKTVNETVEAARAGADVLVGVHIRQGDYKDFLGGKFYFELEEYISLIDHVETMFPNKRVRFLVCTNVSENRQRLDADRYAFGPGSPVEDLYSLAKCDYIFGPPSTFTLWASLYGNVPLYLVDTVNHKPVIEDFVLNKLLS